VRFFVVGIVLAAAAAALFVMLPRETAVPLAVMITPGLQPATQVEAPVAPPVPASPPVPSTAAAPARQAAKADIPTAPAASPAKTFTVRVTFKDSSEAPAKAAVGAYQAAFMERLRVIPGLVLITPESSGVAADAPVDFRIAITGAGPDAGDKFRAGVQVERLGANGAVQGYLGGASDAAIVPACVGPAAADPAMVVSAATPCTDPASIAAYWVSLLRTRMFPADASLRRQLQAQLLDRRLESQQRLMSMGALASLRDSPTADSAGRVDANTQSDPDFVRGAIDLATTAADPALRAQVWRTMREVRSPQLIGPLLAAARGEVDGTARLEAVATLGNFASDARVRPVLESVAASDPRPLVGAIARRGLAGNDPFMEDSWKQYVVASLKDQSRPDAERMEALIYYSFQRGLPDSMANYWNFASRLLDDEGTRAVAQMLPRLSPSAEWSQSMLADLARSVATVDHPAVTEMLLQSLQGDGRIVERVTAVRALLGHADEPRVRAALQQGNDADVRAALEQVKASDRDTRLRQVAGEMLKAQ
jgi:hypothetical protein